MLSKTAAQKNSKVSTKKSAVDGKIWRTSGYLPGLLEKWHFTTDSPQKAPKVSGWLSKGTLLRELLLEFQRFKQFALEIRYFIFKFQKLFHHRVFKNVYTFLHFLGVFRNGVIVINKLQVTSREFLFIARVKSLPFTARVIS